MNWSSIKMVTTVSVCEQNKNDSLTDWHLNPSRWGGENQGENPEDEVKRPTPWGAQHARGHRGWFALMGILTILVLHSGGCGQKVEAEQEKKETADHISQDHCKQDLLHHQPADEGRIRNWGNSELALLLRWRTLWIAWWSWQSTAAWCLLEIATSPRCRQVVSVSKMKFPGCQRRWGSWRRLGRLVHWRWQSSEQNRGLVLWGGSTEERCKLDESMPCTALL